jgi:hypothetical protein
MGKAENHRTTFLIGPPTRRHTMLQRRRQRPVPTLFQLPSLDPAAPITRSAPAASPTAL